MRLRASNIAFLLFAAAVAAVVVLQAVDGFGSAPAPTVSAPVTVVAPPGGAAAGPGVADIPITSFAFPTAPVAVPAGSTVRWTNNDGSKHTVTADDSGFDSPTLAKGTAFEHTFPTAGTFAYHCAIHETMKGTVTVT